jgi:murein tripeptide amidase MpaA
VAAVSTDQRVWQQTAAGQRRNGRIEYCHRVDAETAWFAWGPPFTLEDAASLVDETATDVAEAESFVLARTRGGHRIPALRLDPTSSENAPFGVWVQARQHAWESGSSWVARGLVEWLVSSDPQAAALRMKTRFVIVPIMDVDNVVLGAGGKNQSPHDHNRDWTASPHWPAVAAAIQEIQKLDQQQCLDVFIDLHNPGASDHRPFFYVPPNSLLADQAQRNLHRFLEAASQEISGPFALAERQRESGPGYDNRWQAISKNWVAVHTQPHVVAVTLETSWNTPHSTTRGYRRVGQQLGQALEVYLSQSPRTSS